MCGGGRGGEFDTLYCPTSISGTGGLSHSVKIAFFLFFVVLKILKIVEVLILDCHSKALETIVVAPQSPKGSCDRAILNTTSGNIDDEVRRESAA